MRQRTSRRTRRWSAPSGTRPDWRMHRDQRLDAPVADGHLPILDLLREPRLAAAVAAWRVPRRTRCRTRKSLGGPRPSRKARRKNPDTSITSMAKQTPREHASRRVLFTRRVALTPHERPGMGTVFPGGHPRLAPVSGLEARQALPDIGRPYEVLARRRRRGSGRSLTGTAAAARCLRVTAPRLLPGATGGRRLRDA